MKINKNLFKLNITKMLILMALVPMTVSIVISLVLLVSNAQKDIKELAHNSMVTIINDVGTGFDETEAEA